jgi:hypothetical protein
MTEQRWRTGLQRIPLDGPLGERRKTARNPNAERRRSDPMGADYVSREVMSQCLVSGPSERATQVSQCCKVPISDNVVPVKDSLSAPTRALRRARHFALVEGSAIPTQARS